jgi:hypothetical protein
MNARFLRDEAARFRGMAEDADRPATKERFLAMADDYDARAGMANEVTEPTAVEGEATVELEEPKPDVAPKVTSGRRTLGLKETVVIQRRPVGRPRHE